MGRRAYLNAHYQFVLVKEEFAEVDVLSLADEEYFARCRRLAEYKYPIDVGGQVVAALNLVSDDPSVIMGEPWCVVESTCGRGLSRSQTLPAQSSHNWSSCNFSESSIAELVKLWDCMRKPSVRKRFEVAVLRFSSAVARGTSDEAIVDLAIAAESLFAGKYPGEATYRISVNAVLWLDDISLAPSDVRAFFRNVYQERSRIVHGIISSSTSDRAEMREALTELMQYALKKALFHFAENKSLEWDNLLDKILDLRWNEA